MSADKKLGLMILGTLALLLLLVISGERRNQRLTGGLKVDLKRIEKQLNEGNLSLHPAEFFRPLKSPEEAE